MRSSSFVVAVAIFAGSVGLAAPALADPACGGRLCAYAGINYQGDLLARNGTIGTTVNFIGGNNDQGSSWYNETSKDGEYYENQNRNSGASGWSRCQNQHSGTGWVGTADNDEVSSMYIFSNATTC